DPTVSRRHAQISLEAEGWTWQNLGQAPTFLGGQPVARFVVADVVDIALASPQGPPLRLQAVPDAGHQPVAAGPMRNELAAPGAVAAGPAPGMAAPGMGAPAGFPAAAATGAPPGAVPVGAGAPGYPGSPAPGLAPGAPPMGMPPMGAPGGPPAGAPGFGPPG